MFVIGQVEVEQGEAGDQKVHLHTTLPGRLVLHWGVEGGQDYQGGWRLPGSTARPDGTTQYKDRALQTPWRCGKHFLNNDAPGLRTYHSGVCLHKKISDHG